MHETWWTVLTDPNHIIAESIVNLIEEIITFTIGYWFAKKKVWKKIHEKFDREHGLKHE